MNSKYKSVFAKAMADETEEWQTCLPAGWAVYPKGMPMALHRSCPKGMPLAKTGIPSGGSGFGYFCEMFYAYVLQSEKTNTYYYGHSGDLENRVKHNQGKVRYTKPRRP